MVSPAVAHDFLEGEVTYKGYLVIKFDFLHRHLFWIY